MKNKHLISILSLSALSILAHAQTAPPQIEQRCIECHGLRRVGHPCAVSCGMRTRIAVTNGRALR